MIKNEKLFSFLITVTINAFFFLWMIFGDKGGPCAPGVGYMLGMLFFVPLTVIGLVVSGILALTSKYEIAKGVALAELITTILIVLYFLIES